MRTWPPFLFANFKRQSCLQACAQPIQLDIAVMARADLVNDSSFAIATVGQIPELARTAEVAIAIDQFTAFDFPWCHVDAPFWALAECIARLLTLLDA
jgi:hypothetical protein